MKLRKIGNQFVRYTVDVRGRLQGKYIILEKGKVIREIKYVDDMRHGENIHYYKNGQIAVSSRYYKDKLHGKFVHYMYNGGVSEVTYYKDGRYHGISHDTLGVNFYYEGSCITPEIKEIVEDINNISDREKTIIKIKYGFGCNGIETA